MSIENSKDKNERMSWPIEWCYYQHNRYDFKFGIAIVAKNGKILDLFPKKLTHSVFYYDVEHSFKNID
jgi:hypothetical protein